MDTEVSTPTVEERIQYIEGKRFGALVRVLVIALGVWMVLAHDVSDFSWPLGASMAVISTGNLLRGLVSLSRYSRTWAESMWSWSPRMQGGDWILHLDSPGRWRVSLRVVISELTGMDVRKARDLVESAPCVVATGLSAQGVRNAAALLNSWGAVTHTSQGAAE